MTEVIAMRASWQPTRETCVLMRKERVIKRRYCALEMLQNTIDVSYAVLLPYLS